MRALTDDEAITYARERGYMIEWFYEGEADRWSGCRDCTILIKDRGEILGSITYYPRSESYERKLPLGFDAMFSQTIENYAYSAALALSMNNPEFKKPLEELCRAAK